MLAHSPAVLSKRNNLRSYQLRLEQILQTWLGKNTLAGSALLASSTIRIASTACLQFISCSWHARCCPLVDIKPISY
jgi:hypothetical protein